MPKQLQGLLLALVLVGLGAGTTHVLKFPLVTPANTTAKIIGPASIAYPGQYAVFHVDVPTKDPAKLICIWSVEPVCPVAAEQPLPGIRPTSKPGEAQFDTVAGHWRLSAAIADPDAKTGQIVSTEVLVPKDPPGPGPTPQPPGPGPLPSPGPNPPAPQPPAPDPGGRFAQFTSDVSKWLAAVVSPDKAAEVALIVNGALDVEKSLSSGTLSHLSGLPLRISVASEILRNHGQIKNQAAWADFGNHVNKSAGQAASAGQLNSPKDFAEFLAAFRAGLK